MIDYIDVCLCICKMTLQRSSLKFIINVIQIDTCTTKIHLNFHFWRHIIVLSTEYFIEETDAVESWINKVLLITALISTHQHI